MYNFSVQLTPYLSSALTLVYRGPVPDPATLTPQNRSPPLYLWA
jgi:hypothetical protein